MDEEAKPDVVSIDGVPHVTYDGLQKIAQPEPATESVYGRARSALETGLALHEFPHFIDQLIEAGEASEKRAETAERERDEARELIHSLAVWDQYPSAVEAYRSIRSKLKENASQIVDLIHASDSQRERAEAAERRAENAENDAYGAAKAMLEMEANTLALLKPARPEDGLLPAIREVLAECTRLKAIGETLAEECDQMRSERDKFREIADDHLLG